jgi:DNA-binding XRE family transcriptional regulator
MKTYARTRRRPAKLHHVPESVTWARTRAGMTKRALAQAIGISEQLMCEIESGWRSATPSNLIKIAKVLNCPVVALESKRS